MNGKYVCNELVFNLLMMEYEVIGRITGKKGSSSNLVVISFLFRWFSSSSFLIL